MLEKKEKVLEKKAAAELERAKEFSRAKNKRGFTILPFVRYTVFWCRDAMLLLVHIKFSVYACCTVNLKSIHICLFLCNYFFWYMVHWIIKYVGIPFDTVIVHIIVSTIMTTLYFIKSKFRFVCTCIVLEAHSMHIA